MSHTAICKKTIEAFDGTTIKKGEQVEVTYGLGYDPKDGRVSKIQVGRRYIIGYDRQRERKTKESVVQQSLDSRL